MPMSSHRFLFPQPLLKTAPISVSLLPLNPSILSPFPLIVVVIPPSLSLFPLTYHPDVSL
jgi:hypothetical protein